MNTLDRTRDIYAGLVSRLLEFLINDLDVFSIDKLKIQLIISQFFIFPILFSFISVFYVGTNIDIKVIDTIYLILLIWGVIGGIYYYKR